MLIRLQFCDVKQTNNVTSQAAGGTDFIRAISPDCKYEVSDGDGGSGTKHMCTGDCFIGSKVFGSWDRLKASKQNAVPPAFS